MCHVQCAIYNRLNFKEFSILLNYTRVITDFLIINCIGLVSSKTIWFHRLLFSKTEHFLTSNDDKMFEQFMKTFVMNYEKSDLSSSDDDDLVRENYKKCWGCTDWDHQLICCSACKRTYHNKCHIPPLSKTMTYTNFESYKSWICTMCINMDDLSKALREETSDSNKNTLNENEIKMASRILLELLCDEENSIQFIECPPKFWNPRYYEFIYQPVSLKSVKKRLTSKKNYYTSFTDVINDIKRIYSNSLLFYPNGDPYNTMAQIQENLLNEMLAKWVPQLCEEL